MEDSSTSRLERFIAATDEMCMRHPRIAATVALVVVVAACALGGMIG